MEKYTAWPIVPMYTPAYLKQTGEGQSFALICSACHCVWNFGNEQKQEIIELAKHYGYQLKKAGIVCDKCSQKEQ